jgi:hypothetical protein
MVNSQDRGTRQRGDGSAPHPAQSSQRRSARTSLRDSGDLLRAPGSRPGASVTAGRIAINLPLLGNVKLPPPEQMAYYAGIGALVALEVVEWPVALVLAVGHALITQQHNHTLHEFGQALEDTERG